MGATAAIALIDGEHHPPAVREALDRLERERGLAGVVFCGGEEKLPAGALQRPERHYGRAVETGSPASALRRLAPSAGVVVDMSGEPVLPPGERLLLAAHVLALGLDYQAPGTELKAPRYAPVPFDGLKLAVIGTGKRVGKTAVAGHLARLFGGERQWDPIVVCMGRGGPAEPQLVRPRQHGLGELLAIAEAGGHAASDYLEDAVLAGVTTVGCRRVGEGLAGEPAECNVAEGAALAASLHPGALIFEGSGAAVPPVQVDRTICVVGDDPPAVEGLGSYHLLRADLALVRGQFDVSPWCRRAVRFELRPEPCELVPAEARIAMFTTGAMSCDDLEPVLVSSNLARRGTLAADLDRAAAERCDLYLTELKGAAIDTVALRARDAGARVVFIRNRPVGVDEDVDAALLELADDAA